MGIRSINLLKGDDMGDQEREQQLQQEREVQEERGNRARVEKELERRIQEDKELHPEKYDDDNE